MAYTAALTAAVTITWDGGPVSMRAGTIVAVEPGSALEAQIGVSNLQVLSGDGQNVPAPAGAVTN